ncbi:MAG: hypothetical protein R3C24_12165 [Cyanobacteriota/Melainabacteria group bacterium]
MGKKAVGADHIYSRSTGIRASNRRSACDECTAVDMMKAHCDPMSHPLPIAKLRPDTPAVHILQSIINTTLHYDPEMRYKNITN